jgi:DNA polymerase-3 subunit delta'
MTIAINLSQGVNCLANLIDRPCGKCNQCLRIAQGLHADVQVVDAQRDAAEYGLKKTIGIKQVEDIHHSATLKPFEGRYRVFIFREASQLSEEAANAFLKLLEEPPDSVLMVLLTSNPDLLPDTIVSRCQQLNLNPLPSDVIYRELQNIPGVSPVGAMEIAKLSSGSIGWAKEAVTAPNLMEDHKSSMQFIGTLLESCLEDRFAYAEEIDRLFRQDRDLALNKLTAFLNWWKDLLVLKSGCQDLIVNTAAIEDLLDHSKWLSTTQVVTAIKDTLRTINHLRSNTNARLAIEVLMIRLPYQNKSPNNED